MCKEVQTTFGDTSEPTSPDTTLRNSTMIILFRSIKQLSAARFMSPPPPLKSLDTPEHMQLARAWIDSFQHVKVSRNLVELSFSRSSGPGGQVCGLHLLVVPCLSLNTGAMFCPQNVNKVNTKATVRCALASEWIPPWSRETLVRAVRDVYVEAFVSVLMDRSQSS